MIAINTTQELHLSFYFSEVDVSIELNYKRKAAKTYDELSQVIEETERASKARKEHLYESLCEN